MTVGANRTRLRVAGLMDIRFPSFHLLNNVVWGQKDVGTLARYSRTEDLWRNWLCVQGEGGC